MIKALTAVGWGKQKETHMATYKVVMRPALEYALSIGSPPASSTSINKLQVMQNATLRTATGCIQDTNIPLHDETVILPIHEHIQLHASQYKQKIQHPSHSLHKHATYFNTPRRKNTLFNNCRYITNIPPDPHTVTTTDIKIKINMRHIHTSIVSRHIATRGNIKILRTPPPHIGNSEEILRNLTRRTLAQLSTNKSPFLKSYLHIVDAKSHSSPLFPLCNTHTHTHTTHIISSTAPTYAPHCHPWICGQTPSGDCTAGQMDGESGWWTTSGNIGLPH